MTKKLSGFKYMPIMSCVTLEAGHSRSLISLCRIICHHGYIFNFNNTNTFKKKSFCG